MSVSSEIVQNCSGCGASIYPEHFQRGLAVRQSGQLFCKHCIDAKSKPPPPVTPQVIDVTSLGLIDLASPADPVEGSSLHGQTGVSEVMYRKPASKSGAGATRIHTFHAKLSDGAIMHLDEQVNAWMEAHPDVEVKFATTAVGTWEGKHPEPNLILTLFY